MYSNFSTRGTSALVGYTYPVLHQGKNWFVDFFAMDPYLNKMRRKKYMISDDLKRSEKKRRAAEIIEAVTKQLMTGWNPWVRSDNSRGFIPFEECLARYLEHVNRMDRKKTIQSYTSRVNIDCCTLRRVDIRRRILVAVCVTFEEYALPFLFVGVVDTDWNDTQFLELCVFISVDNPWSKQKTRQRASAFQ